MMYRLPLAAYRVLDLGGNAAAGYAARLLGDGGAGVIVVESPPGEERSPTYRQFNRNKLSCTLDYTTATGADLLRRLVAKSDIVIEGFAAAERESFGLTYEALFETRRDIIVASVRGIDGEASTLTAIVAGTAAAAAVCAALLRHRDSGDGQHVEIDAGDCLRSFVGVSRTGGSLPAREEIAANKPLRERRFFELVSSMSGVEEMPALPWRFSLTPCHIRLPAPQAGEHNRYVFEVLLGLSESKMSAFTA